MSMKKKVQKGMRYSAVCLCGVRVFGEDELECHRKMSMHHVGQREAISHKFGKVEEVGVVPGISPQTLHFGKKAGEKSESEVEYWAICSCGVKVIGKDEVILHQQMFKHLLEQGVISHKFGDVKEVGVMPGVSPQILHFGKKAGEKSVEEFSSVIEQHKVWFDRKRKKGWANSKGMNICLSCGCSGECSCGHSVIDREKKCQLSPGLICPCCMELASGSIQETLFVKEKVLTGEVPVVRLTVYEWHLLLDELDYLRQITCRDKKVLEALQKKISEQLSQKVI